MAFTIFIVTESCVVPLVGYLIDRFGPRAMVFGGGAWWDRYCVCLM